MERRFGVELEFSGQNVNIGTMRTHLNAAVQEHDPNHQVSDMESFRLWTLKGEHCGMEITTPVFEANQSTFDIIHDIVDYLRRQLHGNRMIRRDCGLHVHVDIQEFTTSQIRMLCKVFHSFEGALIQLQPHSRRENSYCARLNRFDTNWINQFNPDNPEQRYNRDGSFIYDHSSGLNFGRFSDRGTIEIRYAAGTIRGIKVIGWIRTLLMLIEISKSIEPTTELSQTESVDDLKDFIRANDTGCKWLERLKTRCCRWNTSRHQEINSPQPRRRRANSNTPLSEGEVVTSS